MYFVCTRANSKHKALHDLTKKKTRQYLNVYLKYNTSFKGEWCVISGEKKRKMVDLEISNRVG